MAGLLVELQHLVGGPAFCSITHPKTVLCELSNLRQIPECRCPATDDWGTSNVIWLFQQRFPGDLKMARNVDKLDDIQPTFARFILRHELLPTAEAICQFRLGKALRFACCP